ncbi:MAG: hypothetical protein ABIK47_00430 [candidate division WOR-3 bacterium]
MKPIIPDYITRLFWDVKKDRVDINHHARYIIRRVLDFGDEQAVKWLRQTYPDALIKDVVMAQKGLSRKTRAFWMHYYQLKSV